MRQKWTLLKGSQIPGCRLLCRYQNIQRTMATEESGGSQRTERSSSTETDPDSTQTGTALSPLMLTLTRPAPFNTTVITHERQVS